MRFLNLLGMWYRSLNFWFDHWLRCFSSGHPLKAHRAVSSLLDRFIVLAESNQIQRTPPNHATEKQFQPKQSPKIDSNKAGK